MLEVDVTHRIGEFDLRAVFAADRGITVLFGPSGAGKSLTLRLIAGIDRPSTGSIRLNGETLVDTSTGEWTSPRDRRVGMVFQESLLLPHRTVLQNVALAVRDGNRDDRRRSARSWLDEVEAGEWADRRPHQLSGGQAQRVALARALAGEPRALLLDEPFNSLDQTVRRRLRLLVRDIVQRRQLPTLFVTHDPGEATELADDLLLAAPGRVGGDAGDRDGIAALARLLSDD
ncbi:MAG TPA: ATP-binding cassette domain-containing protein [Acidimicrobiia bacterium]|jgi:molybdate transport system ATP-binding protein